MERGILSESAFQKNENLIMPSKPARTAEPLPRLATSYNSGEKNLSVISNLLVEEVDVRPENRLVVHSEPHGSASDRYRLLRMRFRDLMLQWRLKSALVTSPLPGDGKSTTIANLATALAENGKAKVLVIEADFYHPCLVEMLGLKPGNGLAEVLEQRAPTLSCVRKLTPLGWSLLPAGQPTANPTELLQGEAFPNVLREMTSSFDWVLVDSPPVIPLVDALLLKKYAHATLLVTRAGRTPRKAVDKALALLGKEHILGVVLNAAEDVNHLYSKYSGHYRYYSPAASLSK